MKNLTEGEKMVCRGCCHAYVVWVGLGNCRDAESVDCTALGGSDRDVEMYWRDDTTPEYCPLETAKEVLK